MAWVVAAVALALGIGMVVVGVRGTQSGAFQALTGHGAGQGAAGSGPGSGPGGAGGPRPASATLDSIITAAAGYPQGQTPVLA